MFCPGCKAELLPVFSRDVVRYLGKVTRLLKTGQLVEAPPKEWLCESCKITWGIEATGVLATADDETIKKHFPEIKAIEA